MTDTPNGYRALPWYSDGYRVYDADGIEVANTFTPELALGSAKAVAKDIAEAANAHYVGKDRIADLERKLKRAHDTMADLHRDWTWEEARAKKAEADLSYYKTASKNFEDCYWAANKRAEKAEARAKELERQLFDMEGRRTARELGLKKRADKAEARVRELEAENERLAERYRKLEAFYELRELLDDDLDTFTAPDGRVFRVGQRVWHIWDEPGEFGHVTDINGGFPLVQFPLQDANDQTHPDNLRRVWDGSEEPDVPVGTVLRDSYGCYLERLSATRWELQTEKGDPVDNDEWANLDGEQFRPYVEVLPGDDE